MNKKKRIPTSICLLLSLAFSMIASHNALAINISITKGWPCNVFLTQPGVVDAPGNYADFNVRLTPTATTTSYAFVAGEAVNYLSSVGLDYNRLVGALPLLEPLGFYFKSSQFGAKFGVDVCVPPLNQTREDVVAWTTKVSGLGALLPSADGDWFASTFPRVSLAMIASNCNTAVGTAMSTTNPLLAGKCGISATPLPGADILAAGGMPVNFGFDLVASRQAVLRITVEEQSTLPRLHAWDAGQIQVEFVDPPLPPLLVGDLVGKQLFSAPDSNLSLWPGCANFTTSSGIAFSEMSLQGPSNSLELRWTGKDNDCATSGSCPNGNIRANNFSFPVTVYLADGSIAPPSATSNDEVKSFVGLFDDLVASGESAYPSNGAINFDTLTDEVYRNSGKAFFSTTVSRLVGAGQVRQCRVWFKRDNGFNCASLPNAYLQTLCQNMS